MSQRIVPYLVGSNVYAFRPRLRSLSTEPVRAPYWVIGIDTANIKRTADVVLLVSKHKPSGGSDERFKK